MQKTLIACLLLPLLLSPLAGCLGASGWFAAPTFTTPRHHLGDVAVVRVPMAGEGEYTLRFVGTGSAKNAWMETMPTVRVEAHNALAFLNTGEDFRWVVHLGLDRATLVQANDTQAPSGGGWHGITKFGARDYGQLIMLAPLMSWFVEGKTFRRGASVPGDINGIRYEAEYVGRDAGNDVLLLSFPAEQPGRETPYFRFRLVYDGESPFPRTTSMGTRERNILPLMERMRSVSGTGPIPREEFSEWRTMFEAEPWDVAPKGGQSLLLPLAEALKLLRQDDGFRRFTAKNPAAFVAQATYDEVRPSKLALLSERRAEWDLTFSANRGEEGFSATVTWSHTEPLEPQTTVQTEPYQGAEATTQRQYMPLELISIDTVLAIRPRTTERGVYTLQYKTDGIAEPSWTQDGVSAEPGRAAWRVIRSEPYGQSELTIAAETGEVLHAKHLKVTFSARP